MSARRPNPTDSSANLDRRQFLATTSTGLLAAAIPGGSHLAEAANLYPLEGSLSHSPQTATGAKKKIPIGVFDAVYEDLTFDAMLDKVSALGLEAMEIGTGGYPGSNHCPLDELMADPARPKRGRRSSKIAASASPRSVATAIRFIPMPRTPHATPKPLGRPCSWPNAST